MLSPAEVLGPTGPISRVLERFAPRAAQQEMAAAVAQALRQRRTLVCEAGTGIGKTFAYLVPAILSGQRILVSTGTKHLQEQIFARDLPLVRKALGDGTRSCLLKGRANYLCLHRLALASDGPARSGPGPDLYSDVGPEDDDLQRVRQWAEQTREGDTAELTAVAEHSPIWPRVTSTAESCLGSRCPQFDGCFVFKARRRALDADLVVVNHHLFFADLALREDGFGELLPAMDAVILDEAHLIPRVATQFFGTTLSTGQLVGLADDALEAYAAEAGDLPGLIERAGELRRCALGARARLPFEAGRLTWSDICDRAPVRSLLAHLGPALSALERALRELAERGPALASCAERAELARERFEAILSAPPEGEPPEERVVWVELRQASLSWHASPLEVGQLLGERVQEHPGAWVFTSATLSVGGSCRHFADRLGLVDWEERCIASPYDYEKQWLGYLPPGLPDPRNAAFHRALAEAVLPVLAASGGRAFLLFTSYRGLEATRAALAGRLPYPVLVQGEAPRSELLRRFRALGDAVLFGTASFWQGVDVRGDALSCVIIDKLPFESPEDPLLAARVRHLRAQGGDPFTELQLPEAVIALKQGAGRLIRDECDHGVLVIGDTRLLERGYGRVFLRSLPPLPLTRDVTDVEKFFVRLATTSAVDP